jgi:hypothetical protein
MRTIWCTRATVAGIVATLALVGCSSSSTAPSNSVPSAPAGVAAAGAYQQMTISWSAVTGATSYNVYWSTTTGVTPATGTKISGATSPYVQSALTDGTPYYYVVTAVNEAGESAPSAQATGTPINGPTIQAIVLSVAGGTNPIGWFEQVSVQDSTGSPISTATVTVNGTALTYNGGNSQYSGSVVVAAGAAANLSVVVGANTYTASGTQFSTFPTVSAPTAGATWEAANSNTVMWSGGAPTTGAEYIMAVLQGVGNIVYPNSGHGPLEEPLATTSANIAGGSLATGSTQVLVGIATVGIGTESTGGIPIANAATGSGMWLGGIAAPVSVTVQ